MQDRMSVEDLAERLLVSKNTVRTWLDKLTVDVERGPSGRLYYAASVLPILETFKAMRGEGKGLATITRIISARSDRKLEPIRSDSETDQEPIITRLEIAQIIKAELTESNDLAEKYARAAHQIGKLESENEYLRAQLAERDGRLGEAKKRIELLEAPKLRPWWAALKWW